MHTFAPLQDLLTTAQPIARLVRSIYAQNTENAEALQYELEYYLSLPRLRHPLVPSHGRIPESTLEEFFSFELHLVGLLLNFLTTYIPGSAAPPPKVSLAGFSIFQLHAHIANLFSPPLTFHELPLLPFAAVVYSPAIRLRFRNPDRTRALIPTVIRDYFRFRRNIHLFYEEHVQGGQFYVRNEEEPTVLEQFGWETRVSYNDSWSYPSTNSPHTASIWQLQAEIARDPAFPGTNLRIFDVGSAARWWHNISISHHHPYFYERRGFNAPTRRISGWDPVPVPASWTDNVSDEEQHEG